MRITVEWPDVSTARTAVVYGDAAQITHEWNEDDPRTVAATRIDWYGGMLETVPPRDVEAGREPLVPAGPSIAADIAWRANLMRFAELWSRSEATRDLGEASDYADEAGDYAVAVCRGLIERLGPDLMWPDPLAVRLSVTGPNGVEMPLRAETGEDGRIRYVTDPFDPAQITSTAPSSAPDQPS